MSSDLTRIATHGCARDAFDEEGHVTEHSAAHLRTVSTPAPADWSRAEWTGFADQLLASVRPFASPNHGRITLPGAEGGYGHAVDGLEGFCRTFLLAGFRIAGERGEGMDELAEFYARGITAGVDPDSPEEERWVRTTEHGQAKVEAASTALILDMTRPWIWDRLSDRTQQQVVEYLSPVVGDPDYPKTNWLWFRVVVETFLRSVGGPWSAEDIEHDLALHASFRRADGWLSDGEERAFDHYTGWALHLYPLLWTHFFDVPDSLCSQETRRTWTNDLTRYLDDAVALHDGDRCRRLVHKHDLGLPVDGAGDGHRLALSTRQPRDGTGLQRNAAPDAVEQLQRLQLDGAIDDIRQDAEQSPHRFTAEKDVGADR